MSGSIPLALMVRSDRLVNGFTMSYVAKQTKISKAYLCAIEKGKLPTPPGEAVIVRLARLLGANPDEYLAAAGRIPTDVLSVLQNNPALWNRLRQKQVVKCPEWLEELSGPSPDKSSET